MNTNNKDPFPCPECGGECVILLKETEDEAGEYECLQCGRKSEYKTTVAMSFKQFLEKTKQNG